MNRQHFKRKQLWRVSRNLRKRRVNLYRLEQRVKQLESHQEALQISTEQTADLMTALEKKVGELLEEKRARDLKERGKPLPRCLPKSQPSRFERVCAWIKAALCGKGNP